MNVLLLMAGPDESFSESGYPFPRNLVELGGLPLVQRVVRHLTGLISAENKVICCLRRTENRQWYTDKTIKLLVPHATIVDLEGNTAGAACTALLAINLIQGDDPLLIINGDQIIKTDLAPIISSFEAQGCDGGIVVFKAVNPRWSYVLCDADGYVVETSEKRPISNLATAGVYYFKRGNDFLRSAMSMVKKDAHVDNKFYIAPVYNELILSGGKIRVKEIDRSAYVSLKTPRDVQRYEEELIRNEAAAGGGA